MLEFGYDSVLVPSRRALALGFFSAWIASAAVATGCGGCSPSPPGAELGDASGSSDAFEASDLADALDAPDADDLDSGLLAADGALTFRLKAGNDVPGDRPNAWAYLPKHFRARDPLDVVVVFHGFRNCIYSYVAKGGRPCVPMGPKRTGYDLAGQMEMADGHAIVVVPEISFNEPTSDPGKLGTKNGLRAFLQELIDVSLAPYVGEHRSRDVRRLALGASSGGYQGLLPALEVGGMRVTDLFFFDALYVIPVKGTALGEFLWHDAGDFDPALPLPKRFAVIYTDNGGATEQSVTTKNAVRAWLADAGHPDWGGFEERDAEPLVDDMKPPIAIVFSGSEHDKIMHRDFWTAMKAAGL